MTITKNNKSKIFETHLELIFMAYSVRAKNLKLSLTPSFAFPPKDKLFRCLIDLTFHRHLIHIFWIPLCSLSPALFHSHFLWRIGWDHWSSLLTWAWVLTYFCSLLLFRSQSHPLVTSRDTAGRAHSGSKFLTMTFQHAGLTGRCWLISSTHTPSAAYS